MGPLLAMAGRWLLAGVAMSIGLSVGKSIIETVNEGNWITDGMKETWTGRPLEKKDELPK